MSGNQEMKDPCDCNEPDCPECIQRAVDQDYEMEMAEHYSELKEQEERDLFRSCEDRDDD